MSTSDPMPAILNILGAEEVDGLLRTVKPGRPDTTGLEFKRATPDFPTEPGLYVVRGATGDEWAVDLFSRDPEGFWYHLSRREISDEQLRLYIGSHPLERLIRQKDADA